MRNTIITNRECLYHLELYRCGRKNANKFCSRGVPVKTDVVPVKADIVPVKPAWRPVKLLTGT